MTDVSSAAAEPVVVRDDSAHRYVIQVRGSAAGFTAYRDRGAERVFYHTVVEEAFAGRGLGTVLIERALSDTRGAGMRVVPVCPFVAHYLSSHHEFDDVVVRPTPEDLTWLAGRTG